MRHRVRRLGVVLALAVAIGVPCRPSSSHAHPLGNFSISQYTEILVTSEDLELHYIVDHAEIPTSQEIREARITPDPGDPAVQAYLSRRAEALKRGLLLEVDGRRLPLRTASADVIFPPGAAGLPTMKLGLVYRAALPASGADEPHRLRYVDANFAGRLGWKEIVAVPAWGVTFARSSVPAAGRSQALSDYPADMLNSPPQVLEAEVVFARKDPGLAGAGTATPPDVRSPGAWAGSDAGRSPTTEASVLEPPRLAPNRQGTPHSAFTDLMTARDLSVRIVLIGLVIAAALGAFHALEPGHGKTIVAAYLIGSRGTAWHAAWLGLIVTATHTAGVYLLGAATLYASRYVVPERLYPWLGVVSGLAIAGVGIALLLRRSSGDSGDHAHGHAHHHGHIGAHHHPHSHEHEHGHDHGEHAGHAHHDHDGDTADHHHDEHGERSTATVSVPALVALGVTGGIVPCPAALVVLLSALSMHRVGFGLLLIVAFSIGLAAVLIAIGLLMVFARRFMARIPANGPIITRWLPLASAVVITLLGVGITAQAILAAGIPGITAG